MTEKKMRVVRTVKCDKCGAMCGALEENIKCYACPGKMFFVKTSFWNKLKYDLGLSRDW